MPDYVDRLRTLVEHASHRLLTMSARDHGRRPAPGKWSPREVIGHLIDSASNNHQRFVRAQFQNDLVFPGYEQDAQNDLVFPGYEQDAWVAFQTYRDARWAELVTLWKLFNIHIARIMENTPDSVRNSPRTKHNLDELAWHPVPKNEPATLDYFMNDYVGHLKHHLAQIFPD